MVKLAGGGLVTDRFMQSSLYWGDIYLSSLKLGGVAPLVADPPHVKGSHPAKKDSCFWTLSKSGGGVNLNPKLLM